VLLVYQGSSLIGLKTCGTLLPNCLPFSFAARDDPAQDLSPQLLRMRNWLLRIVNAMEL
jgi:hypothetical protein